MTPPAPSMETLIRDHGPDLQRLARALVADSHRAEDLVAETWAVALTAAESPTTMREPRGWLTTVLRRRARSTYRREAVRHTESLSEGTELPAEGYGPERIGLRMERERLLHDALERLDEPYRTALFLRFREDLPPRKIAAQLGVPVKTVNTQLARGLEKLRLELGRSHGGGDQGRRAWLSAIGPLAVALPRPTAPALTAKGTGAAAAVVIGALAVSIWASSPRGTERPPKPSTAELASLAPSAGRHIQPSAASPIASTPGTKTGTAGPRTVVATTSAATAASIQVTTLAEDGTPLVGKTLLMSTISQSGPLPQAFFRETTDDAGQATFEWPGTNHFAITSSDKTIREYFGDPQALLDLPPTETVVITLNARPGVRVGGVVRDLAGAPVPGARVFGCLGSGTLAGTSPITTCDVSGRFEVTVNEQISLHAVAPGSAVSTSVRVWKLPESEPGLRTAELTVPLEGSLLTGRVTGDSGEPLVGAWVVAAPQDPSAGPDRREFLHSLSAQTDEDGRYEMPCELRPRGYEVAAFTGGYANQILSFEAGVEPVQLDFVLGRGATVRGRVFLPDGTAAAGSRLHCEVSRQPGTLNLPGPGHWTRADDQGRFEFYNVQRGTLRFLADEAAGMSRARAQAEHSISDSGTVEFDLTLDLEPRISGRVVNESGQPVPGLSILAHFHHSVLYDRIVSTDENGRFQLTALPDAPASAQEGEGWSLEFRDDTAESRRTVTVVQDVAAGTTDLEVVASSVTGPESFLSGRFVRSDGPISPAVQVSLERTDGDLRYTRVEIDPVDGSFVCGPLSEGTYELLIKDPNRNSVGLLGIDLAEGDTLDLGDIDMARGGQVALTLAFDLPDVILESERPSLLKDQRIVLIGPGEHVVELELDGMVFRPERPLEPGDWRLLRQTGEALVLPVSTISVTPREAQVVEVQARMARSLVTRVLMPTDGSWSTAAIRIYGDDGVQWETSPALSPGHLDDEERLDLEVNAPIETVRAVLVVDGTETAHQVEVIIPPFTEPTVPIELDAR